MSIAVSTGSLVYRLTANTSSLSCNGHMLPRCGLGNPVVWTVLTIYIVMFYITYRPKGLIALV